MRKTLVKALEGLVRKDRRVLILVNDIGALMFDEFRLQFPDQFINCGIAEQNMIGVAAGLALSGKIPFIYGVVPFVLMRPFEQIRNDIVMQRANVKIIGTGSEENYAHLGPTHYAVNNEDVKICQILDALILLPEKAEDVSECVLEAYNHTGLVYIKLWKN